MLWIIEYVMEGVHEEFTLAPRENKLSAYGHTRTRRAKDRDVQTDGHSDGVAGLACEVLCGAYCTVLYFSFMNRACFVFAEV